MTGGTSNATHPARRQTSRGHHRGLDPLFDGTVEGDLSTETLDRSTSTFGSRLSPFYYAWSRITSDEWVLRTVERGYSIQFSSLLPHQPPTPALFRDPSHKQLLTQEVKYLMEAGAVEEVPQELRGTGFYSRYFLIPKAKGGLRPILDLRQLNKFVRKLKFRMVSLSSIIPSLDPGDWYAALDLKDAYFHIAIIHRHHRYLRFVMAGTHLQFTVLPFGLSAAPRVFTKCMAVMAAFLRRQGIQVFPYLDDWLIKGRSRGQVETQVSFIRQTFLDLGLLLNKAKSTLSPTQQIEFIGAVLDSTHARAYLPESRFHAISELILDLHHAPVTTAQVCLRLLGHMAACTYVVAHTRLWLRPLQSWLTTVYCPARGPLDLVVSIPILVLSLLRWWLDPWEVCKGVPFAALQSSLSLVMDASDRGWGAHLGHLRTQGLWSLEDLELHINVRELRAVHLACLTFRPHLAGRCVSVLLDNMATVFYINKQGGAHSSPLCREALALWDFCVLNATHLTAFYLPGEQNG